MGASRLNKDLDIRARSLKVGWARQNVKRLQMKPSDTAALRLLIRRFVWMTLAAYAFMSVGLWIANFVFPLGGIDAYTTEISITGALTFGGLYAAASVLMSTSRTVQAAQRNA